MKRECIAPTDIEEGDLTAYLAGNASPLVNQHIAQCDFCQAEAASLKEMDTLFSAALYRQSCPEADDLLQYQAGFLSHQEKKTVQQHLASCPHCQAELAQIESISLEDAPQPISPLNTLKGVGQKIIEAILLPTPSQPTFALRGHQAQSFIYEAEGYQIIIAKKPPIVPAAKQWQVEGQISLPTDPMTEFEGNASLLQNGQSTQEDIVDDFGYFAMESVSVGTYTLAIQLPSTHIHIKDFTIP